MAAETLPQALVAIPDIQTLKVFSRNSSTLEIASLNKSSALVTNGLPEPDNPSKTSSEVESKDHKPYFLENESVDPATSIKISVELITDKIVSKSALDGEMKVMEHGATDKILKTSPIVDEEYGLPNASESGWIIKRSETGERSISRRYRPSTSSDVSDESSCTSISSITKPHKANNSHWEAIQMVRTRDGALGLSHFKLLKKLGCGDIGSVIFQK